MSLGAGLGKVKGQLFRIGHLGDFNDLTLAGTLAGVEMGLQIAGVPCDAEGVSAALRVLRDTSPSDFVGEPVSAAVGSSAEVGSSSSKTSG